MSGDYPCADEIAKVAKWPTDDVAGWFAYVKSIGHWWPTEAFGWSEEQAGNMRAYHISTGGWSGNEEIIDAMQSNRYLWLITWESSRRGGHFEFRHRHAPPAAPPAGTAAGNAGEEEERA